ncbi:nickel-binding protein [Nocardia sp. NPDC057668]|uniref:nickel-binding protein n=1 Tax=Nocardia sp. NPDC057668 TaxID=3346202 RepID=UPI00366D3C1F
MATPTLTFFILSLLSWRSRYPPPKHAVAESLAWADPESGMVFCLSEAPDAEAVRRIHERAGHPADNIYQVPVQA